MLLNEIDSNTYVSTYYTRHGRYVQLHKADKTWKAELIYDGYSESGPYIEKELGDFSSIEAANKNLSKKFPRLN